MPGSVEPTDPAKSAPPLEISEIRRTQGMTTDAKPAGARRAGVLPEKVAGTTMKAVQMYSPYGYRGKIGLIVPSTNTVNEPEFNMMAPRGVSVHGARIILLGAATDESYRKMAGETGHAAAELATAEVDVMAWGCTSGSFIVPRQEIEAKMEAASGGIPAVTAASAVLAALETVGARRVALGTPYGGFVNQAEIRSLTEAGFEVVSVYGLQLGETQEERRGIGRVPPESLYRLVHHIDRPEADAVFLSGANLATVPMLDELEDEIRKPVISSNQATFWRCLRTMGLADRIEGFGSLLTEY
jgi:maleate cis-trans isomerase